MNASLSPLIPLLPLVAMRFFRHALRPVPSLGGLTLALAIGCGGDSTAPPPAPAGTPPEASSPTFARAHRVSAGGGAAPALQPPDGPHRGVGPLGSEDASPGRVIACERRAAQSGSAVIGPAGGTVRVGRNRLIVPPGAIRSPVMITAEILADTVATIRFQPHGLVFRKPAGLVIDASQCRIPDGETPVVVYVDDAGEVIERLPSVYNPWWHSVAAPIEHFSGYSIAL